MGIGQSTEKLTGIFETQLVSNPADNSIAIDIAMAQTATGLRNTMQLNVI